MYLLYIFPPELHTHTYDFIVLTSLTHQKKNLLGMAQIEKAEDLTTPLRIGSHERRLGPGNPASLIYVNFL
jgi:hypothetical protein